MNDASGVVSAVSNDADELSASESELPVEGDDP